MPIPKNPPLPLGLKTALLIAIGILSATTAHSGLDDKQVELEKKKAEKEAAQKKESDKIKAEMGLDFSGLYDKLVIVGCENKYGRESSSGFIARMNGKTYLFTCKRVLLGADKISFKTAEGAKLSPRSVELSTTRDIARLLLAEDTGFEINNKVALDQSVGVFGNSEGGGVVTELYGKIETMGGDSIEVTAPFVTGNSGSPVLNAQQEVVGIASHVKYSTKKGDDGESTTKTRRFCHRLGGDKWMAVNWKKHNKRYGKVYIENQHVVDPIFEAVYEWIDNPYSAVFYRGPKDPTIREWLDAQDQVVERLAGYRKLDRVTQSKLDSMNRHVQREVLASSEKLAAICDRYARRMQLLKSHKDPTGFLQEEFESYSDRFEWASIYLGIVGKRYSRENYYSFKKEDDD